MSAKRQPLAVLTLVVFVAVMREGWEIVLFLYGILRRRHRHGLAADGRRDRSSRWSRPDGQELKR